MRRSKVWAPSAREIAALEEQVQAMARQLASQQQQWQGFISEAQSQLPAWRGPGAPAAPSPSRSAGAAPPALALAAGGYRSPGAPPAGGAADAGTLVREKLQFLQGEVEKVIASAVAMQQQQALRPSVGLGQPALEGPQG